jgi:O-antigen/teichoic acid export membrane protein
MDASASADPVANAQDAPERRAGADDGRAGPSDTRRREGAAATGRDEPAAMTGAIANLLGRLKRHGDVAGASAIYISERIVSAAASFVVFTVLARCYAPAEFGLWSYTIAIVQFAAPFLAGGAEPMVVRELVRYPDRRAEVLGSAAVIIGMTTIVANVVPLAYLYFSHPKDGRVITIGLLAAASTIPNFLLVLEHYLRAEVRPGPIVSARLAATVGAGAAKIAVAAAGYPIVLLAAVMSLEAGLQVIGLIVSVTVGNGPRIMRWSPSMAMTWGLARTCLPTMISGLLVTLFFRVNYLLLENLAGFQQVGYYALAFSILQITVMFPGVLLTGIYPRLVEIAKSRADFDNAARWLFFGGSVFGYTAVAAMAVLGHLVVPVLFGQRYVPATHVLSVMFLGFVIMTSAAVRAVVINILLDPAYHLWSAGFGLLVLVPISWFLIPSLGAVGAAWGIVVSSAASAIVTTWLIPALRPYAADQLLGLFLLTPFRRGRRAEEAVT